jgi:hypothetical protein
MEKIRPKSFISENVYSFKVEFRGSLLNIKVYKEFRLKFAASCPPMLVLWNGIN